MYRLNIFFFSLIALLFFGIKTWASMGHIDDLRCQFSDPRVKLVTDFKDKVVHVHGLKWEQLSSSDSISYEDRESSVEESPSPQPEFKKTYKIGQVDVFYEGDKDEVTLLMTFHDAILRVEFYHQGSDGQTDEEYVHTGTLLRGDRRWVGGCQTLGKLPLPFETQNLSL